MVDDRNGLEVVFGNQEGHFLLVGFRVDGDQVLIGDRIEASAFRRGQDVAQVGGANEFIGFVEDEQRLNDFSLGPNGLDFVQSLTDGKAAFECYILRGHDAAGGFRAVPHELVDVLEVAGFHKAKEFFPKVEGKDPEDVRDVVGGHVGEDLDDSGRLKQAQDTLLERPVTFFDDRGDLLIDRQFAKTGEVFI